MASNGSTPRWRLRWAISFGLLATSYLFLLFYRHLSDPDEGRYAEIPREMLQGGHWFKLTLLGYPYYEKPPLPYWFVASGLKLFGVHDWAARTPLLLGLVLLCWCVWKFLPRTWSSQERLVSFFVLLTTLLFVGGTTYLTTDAILVVFFTLTCASLYQAFQTNDPRRRWLYFLSAGLCGGLGVLTKGAVAIVLPGGITLVWLLFERRWAELATRAFWGAGLLAICVAAPVLILLEQSNPGFLHQFLFEEHIARFLGTRASQLHHYPFWFYVPILPLVLLPWSLFIPRLISTAHRNQLWKADSLFRFLAIWASVVIVFFSFGSGKLITYILPAAAPLGLLLGRWGVAEPALDARDRSLIRIGWLGPVFLGLVLVALGMAGVFQWLPKELPPFSPPILAVLLVPVALLLAGRFFDTRKEWVCVRWGASVSGLLFALALLLSPLSGDDSLTNEAAVFYEKIAAQLRADDRLVVGWAYCPSLAFYTQRLYRPLQHSGELNYGMKLSPNLPGNIETSDELVEEAARGKGRLLVMVDAKKEKRLKGLALPFLSDGLPEDHRKKVFELSMPLGPKPDAHERNDSVPLSQRPETPG